ncbi:MAG: GNAT family N-acetyltransferase [Ignavibacteriaceae bacterium]|nr:GNAT family N-acetyltransferase [Ignavibacteriaceae bacterium]
MQKNYAKNPALFDRCIYLIDEIFPGCKSFAMNGMKYKATWSENSTPFIVEDKNDVIAHAGVWPITLMLNGKVHKTAAIHGVCVKPEYRGKGLFRQLMKETMQFSDNHFESTILFTNKPYLYKDFPAYKAMLPEYDFLIKNTIVPSTGTDLRKLNLDDASDLNLLLQLLSNHMPVSNELSVVNASALFILNTLNKEIHYSEKLNAVIIYSILNNTLYLKDILCLKICKINHIIDLIPGHYDNVVLQFSPDRFLNENEYTPVMAAPECCVMVSDRFSFNGKYFRYPEIYAC